MEKAESFADQLGRLELMADPDDAKWDLSDNDRAAIRALLKRRERLEELLRDVRGWYDNDPNLGNLCDILDRAGEVK
jgi:hypothetical protein